MSTAAAEAPAAPSIDDLRQYPTWYLLARAKALRERDRRLAYRWACTRPDCDGRPHAGMLHKHARASQRIPPGKWLMWAIIAGRGFGKTRTGAETVKEWGGKRPRHVAVIGETWKKTRELCFEHPRSGLLAVLPPEEVVEYSRGFLTLTLRNGTVYRGLTAETPDKPRGYAFDQAWYDEFASWPAKTAEDVHSNVMFALRESPDPRIVVTTTPKPLPHVKKLVNAATKGERAVLTKGHTRENADNLGAEILAALEDIYADTRLGRQELGAELLDDIEGALWQLWMFAVEGFRPPRAHVPDLARVVVAMDPAASDSENSDATGIVVAGRSHPRDATYADQRPHAYVLHAEEVRGLPEARCKRAAELWHREKADVVVVEANKGGDWIPAVMRQVDPRVPVKLVNATRGKITRAEPVSALYQQYRVHHVRDHRPAGMDDGSAPNVAEHRPFGKLEDQMTTWVAGDPDSPDLLDALVWALTELMIDSMPSVQAQRAIDERLRGRR